MVLILLTSTPIPRCLKSSSVKICESSCLLIAQNFHRLYVKKTTCVQKLLIELQDKHNTQAKNLGKTRDSSPALPPSLCCHRTLCHSPFGGRLLNSPATLLYPLLSPHCCPVRGGITVFGPSLPSRCALSTDDCDDDGNDDGNDDDCRATALKDNINDKDAQLQCDLRRQ
jgi:hypothetical protein